MKIVKLFAIALGMLTIVVGALWLSYGGSSSHRATIKNDKAREIQQQISRHYAEATSWDQQAYETEEADIAQYAAQDIITSEEKTLLNNHLSNAATNSVEALLMTEFHKPDCAATNVDALMAGVHFLATKMPGDERLTQLERIHNLYAKIRRFIGGRFRFTPAFDGTSWTAYSAHRATAEQRRDDFRADASYREHLANITELKSGLSAIAGKLDAGRSPYYDALERQIERYFNDIPADEATNAQLLNVYSAFGREAGSASSATSRLLRYYHDRYNSQ